MAVEPKSEMEPKCATCTNWKPRDSGAMGKLGFAICGLGPRSRFMSPGSICARHALAPADVVAARLRWLGAKR